MSVNVKNIGVFGRRNAGKSSIVNIIAGQQIAIVDSFAGTTTDPVSKRIEICGAGPCTLIDTAGVDDEGPLGEKRAGRSLAKAEEVDLALIVFKGNSFDEREKSIASLMQRKGVPFILIHNFADMERLMPSLADELKAAYGTEVIDFSCKIAASEAADEATEAAKPCAAGPAGEYAPEAASGTAISCRDLLIGAIARKLAEAADGRPHRTILQGLVSPGDKIVFVCPIDSEVPAGRLILPQVMGIRDVMDNHAVAIVVQPEELEATLGSFRGIKAVITDSQAFAEVSKMVPDDIPLGSFSILLARAKGPFNEYLKGSGQIDRLRAGDNVLILESCTHTSNCDDIGRVKIPRMLQKYCGCSLNFTFVSGTDQVPDGNFSLAVQCGGCMVTERILCNRVGGVIEKGCPVTNYGMAIAYMKGLFKNRSFMKFMELLDSGAQ